jgi:glutathione S-transferase
MNLPEILSSSLSFPIEASDMIPILYVFAISHYCEKARWALEYYGIEYQLSLTMPGANRSIAKRLEATGGSLPFLKTGSGVIMGSGAILDWAAAQCATSATSLEGEDPASVRSMEQRLDDVTGVHVRRFYYSDALFNDPASVRPIFSAGLPLFPRLAVTLGWSRIVPIMIKTMDLGPEQGAQSQSLLIGELEWLDHLLSDGRPFLTGDRFTRADLTAASLLAPLVNPPKHPTYANLKLPFALARTIAGWQDRPSLKWVSRVYEGQR